MFCFCSLVHQFLVYFPGFLLTCAGETAFSRYGRLRSDSSPLAPLGGTHPAAVGGSTGRVTAGGATARDGRDPQPALPAAPRRGHGADARALAEGRYQPASAEAPAPTETPPILGRRDLSVFASAQAGPEGMVLTYDPIEWIERPAPLPPCATPSPCTSSTTPWNRAIARATCCSFIRNAPCAQVGMY